MTFDFSTLTPRQGTGLTRKSTGREAEANPFLDNGWLKESYDTETDYEVTLPGGWEKAVRKRGENKGQEYDKLIGDAAKVVRMLRDAADKLGIGVAIEVVPAVRVVNEGKRNERTDEIQGMVTVKYLGKVRKVYKDREETNGHSDDTDATEYVEYTDDSEDDEPDNM